MARKSVWGYKKRLVGKTTNYICKVCGAVMYPDDDTHVHHVVPKKLGGSDEIGNLILLHRECHKQVTYSKDPKILARLKSENILKDH
jgi:RNA-directed DNA polymerase